MERIYENLKKLATKEKATGNGVMLPDSSHEEVEKFHKTFFYVMKNTWHW